MKVFEEAMIGGLRLPNRLIIEPTTSNLYYYSGLHSPIQYERYKMYGRCGAGLVIHEAATVDENAIQFPGGPLLTDDKFIPGLSVIADLIHEGGARSGIQLYHPGRCSPVTIDRGGKAMAPSAVFPYVGVPAFMPKAMTREEIKEVIEKFGMAASRAKEAGFESIMIHGAHGFLLQQFMSPLTNKRPDEYGGGWEDRLRFALEVVEAMRKQVGPGFPLIYRLSVDEGVEGGYTINDSANHIVPALEDAGVDDIDITSGIVDRSTYYIAQPCYLPRGVYLPFATRIKQAVKKIPVSCPGRFVHPGLIRRTLEEEKVDFIGLCRALLVDPEFIIKMREGREKYIRMCIGCNEGCITRSVLIKKTLKCALNPEVGRYGLYRITPADPKKRVAVIGGGPAGMEVARMAAERGHKVDLYEKEEKLGGQIRLIIAKSLTREYGVIITYYQNQFERLGVDIHLGREMTPELVRELNPDAVVVATGSLPARPDIKGIDKPLVVTEDETLLEKVELGDNVVVIGGQTWGPEVAHYLAEKGKKVTIVEEVMTLPALGLELTRAELLVGEFAAADLRALDIHPEGLLAGVGVQLRYGVKIKEITDEGVLIEKDGQEEQIRADNIVVSETRKSNKELFERLRGEVKELYCIGDSAEPRKIMDAILHGWLTGMKV